MIVSSRMVKPHMVKKWASPGTVHCRSLRWPGHLGDLGLGPAADGPRVREGSGLPERISRDSQWNRTAAIPKPITVTPMPKMILTGTRCSSPRWDVETERRRSASATWELHKRPEDSVAGARGRSSEAEHQLPKLRTRVRFPSPALTEYPSSSGLLRRSLLSSKRSDRPSCHPRATACHAWHANSGNLESGSPIYTPSLRASIDSREHALDSDHWEGLKLTAVDDLMPNPRSRRNPVRHRGGSGRTPSKVFVATAVDPIWVPLLRTGAGVRCPHDRRAQHVDVYRGNCLGGFKDVRLLVTYAMVAESGRRQRGDEQPPTGRPCWWSTAMRLHFVSSPGVYSASPRKGAALCRRRSLSFF